MKAHYFASKTNKYVIISEGPRPIGERINVKGKAEARKIAAAKNAEPWNF